MSFDLSEYVDVAERERLFFERYPEGRIQVTLDEVRDAGGEIIAWKAQATVWRDLADTIPVCDYAVEPVPGKTPYTRDSEAMNASTSAVGRAIVLAGFPSKKIASADEVRNRQSNGNGSHEDYLAAVQSATRPSETVVHFGKNKGVLLGSLTPAQVRWYATEWTLQDTTSEYDHHLKAAAVALHAGDDTPFAADPYVDTPL